MVARVRLKDDGLYFNRDVDFISSGCTILNCALGGGWARRRVANIVGDTSTGKTLLVVEACPNFLQKFPKGEVHYAEGEAAFVKSHAQAIGLPAKRVKFYEDEDAIHTIEDWHEAMLELLNARKKPRLFILDSLDSLTDRTEDDREFGEGTYGTAKAKLLSEFFRRNVKRLHTADVTILVVSQVRANIGVTFGRKHSRSGGKALDFYSSQIVWLAHARQIVQTRNKAKRAVGIEVKAKVSKNKVGVPFREVEFPIRFDYGVEDTQANLKWLIEHGLTDMMDLSEMEAGKIMRKIPAMSQDDYAGISQEISKTVLRAWKKVESGFKPKRRKYI